MWPSFPRNARPKPGNEAPSDPPPTGQLALTPAVDGAYERAVRVKTDKSTRVFRSYGRSVCWTSR